MQGKSIKSKKLAIIISYMMVLSNTVSNLVLTPLYIRYLGLDTYGLYQMIYAVAHYILILDFGVGTTMVRYIAGYHANNDYESEKNFSAHCLLIVIAIDLLILIAGFFINNQLLKIYPTITSSEADTAHVIFSIMIATIALTIVERFAQGTIMAYEHFVVVRAVALGKVIVKLCITVLMLVAGLGIISIVLADLFVTIGSLLLMSIYSLGILKFKICFTGFDKALVFSMFTFMLAIFLQSIVQYVNNTVDKTILGIMTTKADVAVYSVSMTFITLFNSLPSEISNVFLPQATKLITNNADREELTNFVARPGRYQFMICGSIIAGFALFGKEFVLLWTGKDSLQAWDIALIIMIPNMIPLIENTVISVLDAKKKRLFRSMVLLGISLVNILISIILVSRYGMIGAPIGTAFSFILGYGIIMNIYYQKVIGLNIIPMFRMIFSRTWVCIGITTIISYLLGKLISGYSWLGFLVKVLSYCVVFLLMMCLYGFSSQEKNDVITMLSKFKRK